MGQDTELMEWIKNNLHIRHNQLTRERARQWQKLLMADRKMFDTHALFGYLAKHGRGQGPSEFAGDELAEFLEEFILKVQLALRNRQLNVSFPLFDIVGKQVLKNFQLI